MSPLRVQFASGQHGMKCAQVDENGAPNLEWGHIIECLNKLDASVPEKLLLLSRDESNMLVVTYADVAGCLASAYGDLQSRTTVVRDS